MTNVADHARNISMYDLPLVISLNTTLADAVADENAQNRYALPLAFRSRWSVRGHDTSTSPAYASRGWVIFDRRGGADIRPSCTGKERLAADAIEIRSHRDQ